jgi:D-alanyl-D-alanine carboxypeptidase (penicillin-binding protein 5/6)
MNNTEFARIVSSKEESIEWYEGKKTANVRNTNRLLWSFAGADGVKTGTTNEAGHCLVASATRDGRKFIAVVLNSPNRWGEAASLLEYGFNSFSLHLLAKADQPVTDLRIPSGWPNRVQVYPRENLMAVLPRTKEGFAQRSITLDPQLMVPPVRPGTVVGKVSFKYKGEEVDAVDLIILERVEKDTWWHRLWRRGR